MNTEALYIKKIMAPLTPSWQSAVNKVLASSPMQRLKDIAFLGAIDHLQLQSRSLPALRSRWNHSLSVAALAGQVARWQQQAPDVAAHWVVAGLLHDIGHLPLSHSTEPAVRSVHGLDHHSIGLGVLQGRWADATQLAETLRDHFDQDWLIGLFCQQPDTPGVELFSSPHNLDTLDGINRSAHCMGRTPLDVDALAHAAFIAVGEERYSLLDAFWHLKNDVYRDLIHSPAGLQADQHASLWAAELLRNGTAEVLRQGERQWYLRLPALFDGLRNRQKRQASSPKRLSWNARRYWVNASGNGIAERYQVDRMKKAAWIGLQPILDI